MAYDPRRLRAIKEVVLASGGVGKVPILRAAFALARPRVFITDETTAARLLGDRSARASAPRA
jgi:DNA-binding transcriptional regulator LsrR (DeoR family)